MRVTALEEAYLPMPMNWLLAQEDRTRAALYATRRRIKVQGMATAAVKQVQLPHEEDRESLFTSTREVRSPLATDAAPRVRCASSHPDLCSSLLSPLITERMESPMGFSEVFFPVCPLASIETAALHEPKSAAYNCSTSPPRNEKREERAGEVLPAQRM